MRKNFQLICFVVMSVILLAACSGKEVVNVSEQVSNGQKVSQGITDTEIRVGNNRPSNRTCSGIRQGTKKGFRLILITLMIMEE